MRNRDSRLLMVIIRELRKLRNSFYERRSESVANHEKTYRVQRSARRWQIAAVVLAAYVVLPRVEIGSWMSPQHSAGNDLTSIGKNISTSITERDGALTELAYLVGIVRGAMKRSDHLQKTTQTRLKDGDIRLAAGGGLFALPIVYETMNGHSRRRKQRDGCQTEQSELSCQIGASVL